MQKIKQQQSSMKQVEKMQVVPKAHLALGFVALIVFAGKSVIYTSFSFYGLRFDNLCAF